MQVHISKEGVQLIHPNVKRNEEGKLVALGSCWVKNDELDCYGWKNEEMLLILDKIPACEEHLPVNQYYCLNIHNQETGWVTEDQVTFELESYFGEPYRTKKV